MTRELHEMLKKNRHIKQFRECSQEQKDELKKFAETILEPLEFTVFLGRLNGGTLQAVGHSCGFNRERVRQMSDRILRKLFYHATKQA